MNKNKQVIPPNLNYETVSSATKLLEKRRKMYEIHEQFEKQKEEFKKKEDLFQQEEDEIREKDLKMQEYLIKFCNILSDNDAKKQRAERRYNEEKQAREQKEKQIEELNQEYQIKLEYQKKLEQKVQSLKKYEEYLETVTKAYPDQYQDLSEILSRYNNLVKCNDKLQKMNKDKSEDLDNLKTEIFNYEKNVNHQILQLSNEIKELTQLIDEKENERIFIQQKVDSKSKETSEKILNLSKILMAIDNLYSRCKQEKINKVIPQKNQEENEGDKKQQENKEKLQYNQQDEDNYQKKGIEAIEKLKQIKQYMIDFKSIIEDCKKGKYKTEKKK